MNWLSRLSSSWRVRDEAARGLCAAIIAQARHPAFYIAGAARDDFEGRFGMAALHGALVLRRLRACGEDGPKLAQRVYERLFSDFDGALRENGTGDTRVAKAIRKLGESFFGQARALDAALAGGESLADVLQRNAPDRPATVNAALAAYVRRAAEALDAQGDGALLAGEVSFPEPRSGPI